MLRTDLRHRRLHLVSIAIVSMATVSIAIIRIVKAP